MQDITLKLTSEMMGNATSNEKITFSGHLGTHFDVMNKEFPLDYVERKGIFFDISKINDRDIEISDIDPEKITSGMFVGFYSGYIEKYAYGTKEYFHNHPQLSYSLIDFLLEKKVAMIGVDFAGIRRSKEHTLTDQLCADNGAFVIENLCNMETVCGKENLTVITCPLNFADLSGLPCRVIVK